MGWVGEVLWKSGVEACKLTCKLVTVLGEKRSPGEGWSWGILVLGALLPAAGSHTHIAGPLGNHFELRDSCISQALSRCWLGSPREGKRVPSITERVGCESGIGPATAVRCGPLGPCGIPG